MIPIEKYLRYKETERFLESLVFAKPIPHFVASKHQMQPKHPFGLERIRSFLNELGDPHRENRYIHIAGTSGKTSTNYFTARLFQAQGWRTGMFTSPHMATFAEYFTINQQLPPLKDVLTLIEQAKPQIDQEYEQKALGVISYSEFLLAMALQYFAAQQVDYVALEAFLGGRYDATNVIEQAAVSIITNIGLDHTHLLGETLPEIAAHKVGIVKPGCPLITAEQRPDILEIFRQAARQAETTVQVLGKDFRIARVKTGTEMTVFDYTSENGSYRELTTPMCGGYQARNAALAIRALEIVADHTGTPLHEDALRQGLASTMIPVRYEKVEDDPLVILDGAHNPDKLVQLVSYLQSRFQPDEVIFVCGFTSGKTPEQMFQAMLPVSRTFYLTRVLLGYREDEEPRYLKSVLTALDPGVKAVIALDPFAALDQAMEDARQQKKVVCVAGSLYLAAHLRQRWYPEHTLLRWEDD
ncbi:hypothetical protein GF339_00695 [candidate division KSB3 bacterium]|uniref:tetrahydrofolate synthase n=1 Tax=candidate division KSB3 bacterium TaxID=2044937 RepID=A0A9D5Q4D1_9BACT|nr:hypothetical protein [candidate division KSB3 bacterium]MBD3323067.1 hypothetical protein [candidate division KSB3 bacterium]